VAELEIEAPAARIDVHVHHVVVVVVGPQARLGRSVATPRSVPPAGGEILGTRESVFPAVAVSPRKLAEKLGVVFVERARIRCRTGEWTSA
jgi:hypothetical protein